MVAACIPRKSFAAKKNIAAVILVNQGKSPITVFSKANGTSMEYNEDRTKAVLHISFGTTKATYDGHELVVSKYSLLPVTLQPGEATQCDWVSEHLPDPLLRLKPTTSELTVIYAITPEFGERYGVWHGEASSRTLKVVNQEIQAE